MSRRPHIPEPLRQQLLYQSAFKCVVCQKRAAQLHHIDEDPTNNDPSNLVAVCLDHHDDAHATRKLSQNLTAPRLRDFKRRWTGQVAIERQRIATEAGQKSEAHEFFRVGIAWGYINHRRVSQMLTADILSAVLPSLLRSCVARGVVDENGIIIKPPSVRIAESYTGNSIYDWFPYGDDHALHALYSAFVDEIGSRLTPLHLEDDGWRKSFVKQMVKPGTAIFFVRGQYFKHENTSPENVQVHVLARKGGLHVEYYVDTMNMFGTTSMSVSFSGHKTAASLLIVK